MSLVLVMAPLFFGNKRIQMTEINYPFSSLLGEQKVIPVVAIEDQAQADGLSSALLAGGVRCIEITLRTDYGLEAISYVREKFSDMFVIAGTVTTAQEYSQVIERGAQAVVSPGLTESLLQASGNFDVPFVPGVSSASEIMHAKQYGIYECKMFPANIVGGVPALKAFVGPFAETRFCPTGGVSLANYFDYLSLDNVMCVGGTWLASSSAIRNHQWQDIQQACSAITSKTA